MLGVAASRRPRVEVDDGEVRRPDHLRELGDAELVRVPPGREGHPGGLDPFGPLLGNALLVDRLAGDAVGEAAKLRRALVQRAHDPLADRDVVLREVALRLPRLREEHLVGVRQLDEPLPHLELDERARHARHASRRGNRHQPTLVRSRASPRSRSDCDARSWARSRLVALALGLAATATGGPSATAQSGSCAKANLDLVKDGQLSLATDNPAFPPWWGGAPKKPWQVSNPASGKGYESAVAYAVAKQLGFSKGQVAWSAVPFNNSFRPGKKPFDFYMAQVSFAPERARAVSFSNSYYFVNQAVVANAGTPISRVTTVAGLRPYKLGAQVGTTSYSYITRFIRPSQSPAVYDSNNDAISALGRGPDRRHRRRPPDRLLRRRRSARRRHDRRASSRSAGLASASAWSSRRATASCGASTGRSTACGRTGRSRGYSGTYLAQAGAPDLR